MAKVAWEVYAIFEDGNFSMLVAKNPNKPEAIQLDFVQKISDTDTVNLELETVKKET